MEDAAEAAMSGKKREIQVITLDSDDEDGKTGKIVKEEERGLSQPPTRSATEDSKQLYEAWKREIIAKTKNDELERELNEMRKAAETAKDREAELTLRNHELSSEISFIRGLMPPLLHLPTPLPHGVPPTHLPPPQFTSPHLHALPTPQPSPHLAPPNLLPPSPMSLLPPPPPAPLPEEVQELHRQVRELQDKFREACRIGREAESRAKQASSAMIKTSLQLADAQSREAELKRNISALNEEKEGIRKTIEETIRKNVSLVIARQLKLEENHEQSFIDQLPQRRRPYLFTIGDPIDVFQLCRPDGPESISLDDAVDQMQAKLFVCGEEWWRKYCNDSGLNVKLACRVCDKEVVVSTFIVEHFVAKTHVDAVRARGAAVSLPALQHWLRELQLAADAARCVQQVLAAAGVGRRSNR